jgi:hypothetical protein
VAAGNISHYLDFAVDVGTIVIQMATNGLDVVAGTSNISNMLPGVPQ